LTLKSGCANLPGAARVLVVRTDFHAARSRPLPRIRPALPVAATGVVAGSSRRGGQG